MTSRVWLEVRASLARNLADALWGSGAVDAHLVRLHHWRPRTLLSEAGEV